MTKKKQNPEMIVFCDTKNKVIDEAYADALIDAFRKSTNWKVVKGTPIWEALREFSKGYSVKKRDVVEVMWIFRMANKI